MNKHTRYSGLTSDPCEEVLKWKHPFTCIVGGPSGSGKMSFDIKLIKHADVMFTEIPQSISWHYGEFQQWMLNPGYSSINLIEGLPDMTSLDPTKVNLLIIDERSGGNVVYERQSSQEHERSAVDTKYIPSKQTF